MARAPSARPSFSLAITHKCHPGSPYPGKLGVVEEGALADLLLVDGNPLNDINLIANPDENFLIIMKDGKIYKNARNL